MKKKILLFSILSFSIITCSWSQDYKEAIQKTSDDIHEVLEKIRTHFELITPTNFVDPKTGDRLSDLSSFPDGFVPDLPGRRSIWSYEIGVVHSAMIACSEITKDERYLDYSEKSYAFVADNLEYIKRINLEYGYETERLRKVINPGELDDCGSMGAALIKLQTQRPDERYNELIDLIANFISNKQLRLEDGTFAREGYGDWEYSLWTDDLYMSVPFLVQMGKYSGDTKYFDDAVKQIINFSKYLFVEDKGLFDHGWHTNVKYDTRIFWGRQNGWALLAMAELLQVLPEDYPGRKKVLDIYQRDISALVELQSPEGLWHQVLDMPETYLETSCSAMYTYAIAKGVNEGWVEPQFAPVVLTAWEALEEKVTKDGQIQGVCMGTGIGYTINYYAERAQRITAYHGYGPMLMAGSEILRLFEKFEVKEANGQPHFWRR